MATQRDTTWMAFMIAFCLLPATICANCITKEESTDIAKPLGADNCNSSVQQYFSLIYVKDTDLYIGSSNSLYKVDQQTFTVQSMQCINPDVTDVAIACNVIASPKDEPFDCENQISVIEEYDTNDWLVCGTNALTPACWKCDSTNETWVCTRISSAVSRNVERFVPRGPTFDSTWYYNQSSGLTFAGTEVQSHQKPYFSRLESDYGDLNAFLDQLASTDPDEENWLNTPAFVGKPIHRGDYIYFFFRETATEYKNAGKIIYPRVGRVCADNKANKITALADYFQTFVKARLNCSIDLNFPFYFNEIQDVYHESDTPDIVYAVFTTPSEGPPASAVCAYSMAEIEDLFDNIGRYKGQASNDADWLPSTNNELGSSTRFGMCDHRYPPSLLTTLSSHNLIDQLVPNLRNVKADGLGSGQLRKSDSPLLYYNNYRFSSIIKVDGGGDNDPIVFMIGTGDLRILKAAYNPSMQADEYGSIITEIMLNASYNVNRSNEVKDMVMFTGNETYVIATAISDVFKVRIEFCDTYETCEECLRVMDPHCQWDDQKPRCFYDGSLVSNPNLVNETCKLYRDSETIDQVKTFGEPQRYSTQVHHNLSFYSLLVAEKGSNINLDLSDVDPKVWTYEESSGATSNTEFSTLRLTLIGDVVDIKNVSIPVTTFGSLTSSMTLKTSVIKDKTNVTSDPIAEAIFNYDSMLARYKYSVTQVRQDMLETCSKGDGNSDILMCPGFRFQEDNDSFTCPAY